MKIIMRVVLFLVMVPTFLYSQTQSPEGEATQFEQVNSDCPRDPQSDYMQFVPNEVLVKFKDVVEINLGSNLKSSGVTSIDYILEKHGISEFQRIFPEAVKYKSPRIVRDPQGRDMVIPNLDNIFKLYLPENRSSQSRIPEIFIVIEELKALPEVEYAEPNYLLRIGDFEPAGPVLTQEDIINAPDIGTEEGTTTGLVPNDPLYRQQWGIPACNIDEVWNTHTGDTTSIIAILDTGVDWLHPDLVPNIWQNTGEIPGNSFDDDGNGKVDDVRGWDFINNDNNPADDNSHGTHCAGIAAAVGNNGIGVAGVNWNARIMPIKVFQSSGFGNAATIASGVNYAASKGATVLSMSFGSYAESLTLKNALANAYSTAVLVAAAGNDESEIGPCADCYPMYPAAYSFVLGVEANKEVAGNCDYSNTIRACFSNFDQDGPVFSQYDDLLNYELKAPGVDLISCIPGGNYRKYSGTSMAAPLAAACISMYKELKETDSHEMIFGNFINTINNHLDLEAALNVISVPKLNVVSYQLFDTIDGDNDGRADARETIELKVLVRNTWGQADSVYVGVEFDEFEDQTTATILRDSSFVGSMSAYSTLYNSIPLRIRISDTVQNNRDICFLINLWNEDPALSVSQSIHIKTENGINVQGRLTGNTTWDGSKLIILTNNVLCDVNDTLTILPGTQVLIRPGKNLQIRGTIFCNGTPNNPITIKAQDYNPQFNNFIGFYSQMPVEVDSTHGYISGSKISFTNFINFTFIQLENNGTYFSDNDIKGGFLDGSGHIIKNKITDCIRLNLNNSYFKDNSVNNCHSRTREDLIVSTSSDLLSNTVANNYLKYSVSLYPDSRISILASSSDTICNNTFVNNTSNFESYDPNYDSDNSFIVCSWMSEPFIENNNFVSNGLEYALGHFNSTEDVIVTNNYWEKPNNEEIDEIIWDTNDDFNWNYSGEAFYEPFLFVPTTSGPAFVHMVKIDSLLCGSDIIGIGTHQFDIIFSRKMDISLNPSVFMGVRYPFNQIPISQNGSWSADSTIYTVYGTVDLNTGDGINTISVSGAQDTDHFEIPIEDRRFRVIVNAAGSASAGFQATPGLGKIELEWNNAGLADGLGFNMYRKTRTNDSTLSQPVLINSQLITDTLYSDFNVIPGQQYYYYYKILRTNLSETDSSKMVAAVPLTASIGDANGDLTVNVLDITTLVAYLLNNNPQPFIFDAADVNADDNINVLDIVGLVNLVMGNAKSGEMVSNEMAFMYIENDTVFADVAMAIGGIQLELGGIGIEDVKALKALSGFESGYCVIDCKLRLLYYSMTGNTINAGKRIPLLKLGKQAWIDTMILADTRGNAVPVEYKKPYEQIITDDIVLLGQNYPNPFTGETIIPVIVYQPVNQIIVQVVNMYGQIVAVKEIQSPKVGENLIRFNSIKYKGIYTYTLEVLVEGQIVKNQSKKLIKQ